jgi:hypothetical protein
MTNTKAVPSYTLPKQSKNRHFFFFFFLGPVCVGSGSTSAFKAYCAALNFEQHRFIIPVSLIKRQRSLTEAVLISFGSTNGFPKIL